MPSKIRLVVGLGNPGREYERTRHNAGYWLVERFAVSCGIAMRKDLKYQALVGRHESGAWLLLPQTFMNASGRSVLMLAGFFRIAPEEILVVHDELDFEPGVAKIKQGGGIAGHNGLRDISQKIASHDYWRLRIGIGPSGRAVRLSLTGGISVYPGGEFPRLPLLGLRALTMNELRLTFDGDGRRVTLRTNDRVARLQRWLDRF